MNVRVRIAPSPTGDPHIGTAYIALFNYAFARKYNGKFILRIEDTDLKRSSTKSEKAILTYLKWIGLSWDEGPDIGGPFSPYKQSNRLNLYNTMALDLVKKGHAYWCNCTQERLNNLRIMQTNQKIPTGYDKCCRNKDHKTGVIRMKIPEFNTTQFSDSLRGTIEIKNTDIDDQIILKTDGFPTYHFANVIDDHFMEISHVIRGEEWISSTPKHVLLYSYFNWTPPIFTHLPLLRNMDKSKISKRKNHVSLRYFKTMGYLPEAILNFLGLIAFSFKDGREIFSLHDFIENFDINRVSLGGPCFDFQKLRWLNSIYLKKKDNKELVKFIQRQLFSSNYLSQIVPLIKERITTSDNFLESASFFFQNSFLINLSDTCFSQIQPSMYNDLFDKLFTLNTFLSKDIEQCIRLFASENQLSTKSLFMSLRIIFTGKKESPPLFQTMEVLGKERCYIRFKNALEQIQKEK